MKTLIRTKDIARVEPSGENNDYQEHVRTVCKCDDCGHRWHPKQMEFTIDEI